jgi:DNA-binding CsgD family transcriptional regulator
MIRTVAQDPARRGPGGIVVLERPSGRRSLAVLVAALPSQAPCTGRPVQGALLIIGDPEQSASPLPAILAASLGLSPAEARLLSLLLQDLTLAEAADRLGLSLESQRVRLKRIFAKTGTNRQSELIGLALRLPAVRPE